MSASRRDWRDHFGLPEVRAILARAWDPIGVYGDRRHVGEHDEYAAEVLGLLEGGASEPAIAAALERLAREQIGVPRPDVRAAEAATELASWYDRACQRLSGSDGASG